MFGQNPIRKRQSHSAGLLQVREIFHTLQGEGPFSGHSAVFIRFTGCMLKCHFCDTQWDDQSDSYQSVDEIVAKVLLLKPISCRLAVVTGGESLRQDMDSIIERFAPYFEIIQFETAGVYWQDCLDHPQVRIVCSPKTPLIHPKIFGRAHVFKYVTKAGEQDPTDGLPVMSTQRLGQRAVLARPRPGAPVYLSPMDEQDSAKNAANLQAVVAAAQKYGYIAGIQLHKLFGVE